MRNTLACVLVLLSVMVATLSACITPAADDDNSAAAATPTAAPPLPTQTPPPITTEELVGFLDLDAAAPSDQNATHGTEPKVGWVFLNGQLVSKLPVQQRRMLVPGTYEVRVVLAHEGAAGVSFWTVSWPQIKIERGRTQVIKTQKVLDDWQLNATRADGLVYQQSPAVMVTPAMITLNDETEQRLVAADDALTKAAESFEKSDAWKAINAAAVRLQLSPPSRPRVWIELPQSLGGARELEAEQLRLLQKRMTPNFGSWVAPIIFTDPSASLSADEEQRLRAMVAKLSARARGIQQQVTQTFDGMIAALNKAPEG